jgi:hypothetical protein
MIPPPPKRRFLPLPAPVDVAYGWETAPDYRARRFQITVTWRAKRTGPSSWKWSPTSVNVSSGAAGLPPTSLVTIPWLAIIAETHPDAVDLAVNAVMRESDPVPSTPPLAPRTLPLVSLAAISREIGSMAFNILRRHGIDTVEVAMLLTREELLSFKNLGVKSADRIEAVLAKYRVEAP